MPCESSATMKHTLLLLVFVVWTVVAVAEHLEKNELPATVFPADEQSSKHKPTPKTTTTTPKTTKPTPKTTTTPTNTTTTPKTTVKPPQPTPPTNLSVGVYSTKNENGTCLLAQMALQIRLESAKVNGTFIVQPNRTSSNGMCEVTKASLNISFAEGFLNFIFNKNSTGNSVYLDDLSFSLFYPFSTPAVSYHQHNTSLKLFPARVGHAYSCRKGSIYMGNGLYLDVTQNLMQAFTFTEENKFDVSDPCPADASNYTVAIVVGIILLILIIIVVVAYVLGRRRRSGGYQPL